MTGTQKVLQIRGAAALLAMLDMIEEEGSTDHDVAKVLMVNELELREMLDFVMNNLWKDIQ